MFRLSPKNIKYQGCKSNTLKRYEITPCPSKFITPAPIKHRQIESIDIQTEERTNRETQQKDMKAMAVRNRELYIYRTHTHCIYFQQS